MSDMNFASLSPTLLARKGGAKPAMRRQSIAIAGSVAQNPGFPGSLPESALEDLGWNDLGEPDRSPAKTAQSEPQHTAHAASSTTRPCLP